MARPMPCAAPVTTMASPVRSQDIPFASLASSYKTRWLNGIFAAPESRATQAPIHGRRPDRELVVYIDAGFGARRGCLRRHPQDAISPGCEQSPIRLVP